MCNGKVTKTKSIKEMAKKSNGGLIGKCKVMLSDFS
jgi:hypothetical protein